MDTACVDFSGAADSLVDYTLERKRGFAYVDIGVVDDSVAYVEVVADAVADGKGDIVAVVAVAVVVVAVVVDDSGDFVAVVVDDSGDFVVVVAVAVVVVAVVVDDSGDVVVVVAVAVIVIVAVVVADYLAYLLFCFSLYQQS